MKPKQATIYYYDVFKHETDKRFKSLKDVWNGLFPDVDSYTFNYQDEKYCFEVLEKTEDYIFIRLASETDLKEFMIAVRGEHGENIDLQKSNELDKFIFQKFTFFLVNYNSNSIALINNKKMTKFEEYIKSYSINKFLMYPLNISRKSADDIKERIKNFNKITSAELTFSDISSANYQTKFNNIFGSECYFKNLKIKVSLRQVNKLEFAEKLNDTISKCKNICITGINDEERETFNLIGNYFTKKSQIALDTIYDGNYETIKKALIN